MLGLSIMNTKTNVPIDEMMSTLLEISRLGVVVLSVIAFRVHVALYRIEAQT